MNIYFVRHSIAENISIDKNDFDRELTEEGKYIIKKTSEAWKNYIENVDVVLTSPLKRALQTAEILAANLQNKQNVIKDNNLGTGSRTADLIDILNSLDYKDIFIVGHQPDLSIHVNNFCGTGSFNISFPPASIAKIELDNGIKYCKGRLVYFIPPLIHI